MLNTSQLLSLREVINQLVVVLLTHLQPLPLRIVAVFPLIIINTVMVNDHSVDIYLVTLMLVLALRILLAYTDLLLTDGARVLLTEPQEDALIMKTM